jgi:hypothetical protein
LIANINLATLSLKLKPKLLAVKSGDRYSGGDGYVDICRFAFAIARSASVCLRGSRAPFQGFNDKRLELPARVLNTEARL